MTSRAGFDAHDSGRRASWPNRRHPGQHSGGLSRLHQYGNQPVDLGKQRWRLAGPARLGRDARIGVVLRHRALVASGGPRMPMVHPEKLVTAVAGGTANTRSRDFGDVYVLSGKHPMTAVELAVIMTAITALRQRMMIRAATGGPQEMTAM